MKSRRASSLWPAGLGNMVSQYKVGDPVRSTLVSAPGFYGVVEAVDPKINKVFVAWGGGAVSQHDPDEIMPVLANMTRGRRIASMKTAGIDEAVASAFVRYLIGDHKIALRELSTLAGKKTPDSVEPSDYNRQFSKLYSELRKILKGIKTASDEVQSEDVPHGEQYLGDPDEQGVEEPVGGGFSIMQDLVDVQREEMLKQYYEGPKTASRRCRKAMYWCGPDRTYRLKRSEQNGGTAVCPKCKGELHLEPFVKGDRMYVCDGCKFKVPTSKVVTKSVQIDVDGEGAMSVKMATRRGKFSQHVAGEKVKQED